jgi:hypothetical protein
MVGDLPIAGLLDNEHRLNQNHQRGTELAIRRAFFADGRLLLTYGNRQVPRRVDARLSANEGQTSTEPVRVADFEGDGGYLSSV